MRKSVFLSIIIILAMVFVLFSCGNVDVDTSIKVYDDSGRCIGNYIDISYNTGNPGTEVLRVLTPKGYIVSFEPDYNDPDPVTTKTLFWDFFVTTFIGWENDQGDNERYISENDKEKEPNYVYFNSALDEDYEYTDTERFWVHDGNPDLSNITISGWLTLNSNLFEDVEWEIEDVYRLVEKSRSEIGLPPKIDFPLSIR